MPKYAALIYTTDVDWSEAQFDDTTAEYNKFGEIHADSIAGGASLHPTATATTVRVQGARGGDVTMTDGPYAETKEALMGFYLLEAPNLDGAVAIAKDIPGAWQGAVEVRPVLHYGG
jgi:hypothetical protein